MRFKFLLQLALLLLAGLSFSTFADVTEVDNAALEKLHAEGVPIIDVRRPDEWKKTGIIEGSHPITFFDAKGNYDVEDWLSKLSTIVSAEQPFVLICAQGVRSSKIANFLDKRLGYEKVSNVTKGIAVWIDDKGPVVSWEP
ncbi:MAG: rhodanese-like domain-containing protein [Granulosicoccus sp.]|nr:rhodanese-like domain-containing protein [Granulosicoccus sp.]